MVSRHKSSFGTSTGVAMQTCVHVCMRVYELAFMRDRLSEQRAVATICDTVD